MRQVVVEMPVFASGVALHCFAAIILISKGRLRRRLRELVVWEISCQATLHL